VDDDVNMGFEDECASDVQERKEREGTRETGRVFEFVVESVPDWSSACVSECECESESVGAATMSIESFFADVATINTQLQKKISSDIPNATPGAFFFGPFTVVSCACVCLYVCMRVCVCVCLMLSSAPCMRVIANRAPRVVVGEIADMRSN
jgi:hypothetical protein